MNVGEAIDVIKGVLADDSRLQEVIVAIYRVEQRARMEAFAEGKATGYSEGYGDGYEIACADIQTGVIQP